MARNISISVDEYYHVYNRGTDKRVTFQDEYDYKRFMVLLYLCNGTNAIDLREHYSEGSTFGDVLYFRHGEKLVDIGAYCLMPNHFHLLLREIKEGGISSFMQKLSTGYTMYFNKRNERTGSLFEGRFKAKHADTDEYLKYLFSYIHLNPLKLNDPDWKEKGIIDLQKTKEYLNEYPYSSYHDFFGRKRPEKAILSTGAFPGYFETRNDFDACLKDWLTYHEDFNLTKVQPS